MYNMTMEDLELQRNNLVVKKMQLDRFFSLFLEKFERKMDPAKPDTPVWKLYKEKYKEYADIDLRIRTTDYYINKLKNV